MNRKNLLWIIPVLLCFWIPTIILYTPQYQNVAYSVKFWFASAQSIGMPDSFKIHEKIKSTELNIALLQSKLTELMPDRAYILINTVENKFVLRNAKDTIRTGICSTGKNELLIGMDGKQYIFKTPKGKFSILLKRKAPPWVKPDWAFIEEGVKPPSARSAERIEQGSLGEYALNIGNSYMLHGTLYQRFLGLPVTHGCVRFGEADLRVIFNTLNIGDNVYIY